MRVRSGGRETKSPHGSIGVHRALPLIRGSVGHIVSRGKGAVETLVTGGIDSIPRPLGIELEISREVSGVNAYISFT